MSQLRAARLLTGIDFASLEPLQRVLLITDGTLTEILEAFFLEPIELVKVGQRTYAPVEPDSLLECDPDECLLERKVVLRGTKSRRNYVYAESTIAVDRLDPRLKEALLQSSAPLGRLWLDHRLETYKELMEVRCEAGSNAAPPVDCPSNGDAWLSRVYRVFSAGRPVMIIGERFPLTFAAEPVAAHQMTP